MATAARRGTARGASAARGLSAASAPSARPGAADGLTRTQAEAELRRRIATDVVVTGAQRRTVAEAGDAYLDHLEHVMERKRTTLQDYRGYLRTHLAPFFGGRPLDKIDRARVEAYLRAKKQDGLSSKTVQNHLNFLHGIFAFSIKREWATVNPVALVDRPKASRSAHRRIRFLQPEELEAVVRAVPQDELGAIERPLYLAAAMTGLRQGELIGLRRLDVDWSAGRIRVAESYTRGALTRRSPTAAARCRWPIAWPASSSATSKGPAGAVGATSSSRIR